MLDERVRKFIKETVQSIVGLDIVLHFQANPKTFDTAGGLALRLRKEVEDIKPALARLVDGGILEVHIRGDGRYRCYSLVREPAVWNLLCMVSETYIDDAHTRGEIVRMLIRQRD